MKPLHVLLAVSMTLLAACKQSEESAASDKVDNASSSVETETPVKPVEVNEAWKDRIPTLVKNGKRIAVSRKEFIEHHLKSAKGRFALIPVPDG